MVQSRKQQTCGTLRADSSSDSSLVLTSSTVATHSLGAHVIGVLACRTVLSQGNRQDLTQQS